jgi:hypothetical protein
VKISHTCPVSKPPHTNRYTLLVNYIAYLTTVVPRTRSLK